MYAPDNSSYRILIADDEPHIRQILRFTLERAGYQVFTASDGEEALARAAEIGRASCRERVFRVV